MPEAWHGLCLQWHGRAISCQANPQNTNKLARPVPVVAWRAQPLHTIYLSFFPSPKSSVGPLSKANLWLNSCLSEVLWLLSIDGLTVEIACGFVRVRVLECWKLWVWIGFMALLLDFDGWCCCWFVVGLQFWTVKKSCAMLGMLLENMILLFLFWFFDCRFGSLKLAYRLCVMKSCCGLCVNFDPPLKLCLQV